MHRSPFDNAVLVELVRSITVEVYDHILELLQTDATDVAVLVVSYKEHPVSLYDIVDRIFAPLYLLNVSMCLLYTKYAAYVVSTAAH